MIARIFLSIVGLLYLALAIWCSLQPQITSDKVGFQLKGGSGLAEFVTVYGGLEFGMALMFLLPWLRPDWTTPLLVACVLIHGSLVLFRTWSLFRFSEFEPMTRNLAISEWLIFLAGLAVLYFVRPEPVAWRSA